ncbi:MAG: hypothetical protein ACYCX4_08500 [Bacillota bacterium]
MIEPRNELIGKVDGFESPEDNIQLNVVGEFNWISPGSKSQACYTMITW